MEARPTKFGRYHVAEPFRAELFHAYSGAPLKQVTHEIPIPVLDQEDLGAQQIDTSALIPGAPRVDALGSCTANATTASLAERYAAAGRSVAAIQIAVRPPAERFQMYQVSTTDAAACEKFAILFYDECTHQTGNPATEWPPADCGSTGLYCCREAIRLRYASTYKTGTGAHTLASLLQSGSVIMGSPWFNDWMTPDASGFVDRDGSMEALHIAMNSGVAGGHETCIYALSKLVMNGNGTINLQQSWVQVRNSWSASWGLNGDYRIHLSTLDWLAQSTDFKQFVL